MDWAWYRGSRVTNMASYVPLFWSGEWRSKGKMINLVIMINFETLLTSRMSEILTFQDNFINYGLSNNSWVIFSFFMKAVWKWRTVTLKQAWFVDKLASKV